MASDLISQIAGLYFRDRIEKMNDYRLNASDIQSEQLFDLLREAEMTEWAKKYDFKTIISYQDFRERIPLSNAETITPYIQRMEKGEINLLWPGIPKQVFTSFNGTRIPVSEQALNEVFIQGIYDGYAIHLYRNPESRLFAGYFVTVGNDSELPLMDELDGFLRKNEPFLNSLLNLPRQIGVQEMSDSRIRQLVKEIGDDKVSSFKGSPRGLERLISQSKTEDGAPSPFLADAEILFHKTTALSSDLKQLKSSLPLPVPVQSAYCSPEGFFGIQDDPSDESYLLMLDLSTFYEFLSADDLTHQPIPLEDVITGIDYQLVLTNCSGLWRYLSGGPKLRFISANPYRFLLV